MISGWNPEVPEAELWERLEPEFSAWRSQEGVISSAAGCLHQVGIIGRSADIFPPLGAA